MSTKMGKLPCVAGRGWWGEEVMRLTLKNVLGFLKHSEMKITD